MAAAILNRFKQRLSGLTLIPSSGGCFELSAGSELIYSKLLTGEFPADDAMLKEIERRLN